MALALTAADVLEWTDTTVSDIAVSVAATQIDELTGYTVDEHVTARQIDAQAVRMAWAVVAVRLDKAMRTEAAFAVTNESQGDYSAGESVTLAVTDRYRSLIDGRPSELLRLQNRAIWSHV